MHSGARRLQRGRSGIVGPWISEVGFEVLYWIPFLRWHVERYRLSPDRLVAVSRGGVDSWYADVCSEYREIFNIVAPDEFRLRTEQRWLETGGQKHMASGSWDLQLLRRAIGRSVDRRVGLHPSIMYQFFRRSWKGTESLRHIFERTSYRLQPAPRYPEVELQLPDRFFAVKFYFRPSFPDTAENRSAAREIVESLTERLPVVILSTNLSVDDHEDFDPIVEERVVRVLDGVPPERNLAAQSAVIARSEGFVGTYGGFSYLASTYGVPSIGFASDAGQYLPVHLEVGRHAAAAYGSTLSVLRPQELPLLGALAQALIPAVA